MATAPAKIIAFNIVPSSYLGFKIVPFNPKLRQGRDRRAALPAVLIPFTLSGMPDPDALVSYPWIIVRIACRRCDRRGSY
jgi:hypothetical protein